MFKTTAGLRERFGPDRVWNTPISEQAIAGAAMGAAMAGLRPVAEIMFSDFYATCWDQVANEIPKLRYMTGGQLTVPLVLRGANGSGGLGFGSQHGQSVENWAMCVPGLKIASPAGPAEAFGLLAAAIRDDDPVIVFEHKALYARKEPCPEGEHVIPLGRAAVVRPGRDCTLVGLSITVGTCLAAAGELAARGIEAEVIDLRTLVPLDAAAVLASVARTGLAGDRGGDPGQLGWGASHRGHRRRGGVRLPGGPGHLGQRRQRAVARRGLARGRSRCLGAARGRRGARAARTGRRPKQFLSA